jgi:multiple sugar transport system permease protein
MIFMMTLISKFKNKIANKKINKERLKRNLSGWAIMLPSLILFAFFIWIPLISNIKLSFFSTIGFNIDEFVWFQNYIDVFKDPRFITAFFNDDTLPGI